MSVSHSWFSSSAVNSYRTHPSSSVTVPSSSSTGAPGMPAVATPASSRTWTTSHRPTRSAMPSAPPSPHPPRRPRRRAICTRTQDHHGARRTTRSPDTPPPPPPPPAHQDAALQPPVVRTGVRASRPSTSPLQEPPKQRAHSRADTSFSRQIRLRQIRHSLPQDLLPLLKEPVSLPRITNFNGLNPRLPGLRALADHSMAQPLLQHHQVNAEVFRDLLDPHSELTTPPDTHHIITELDGIGGLGTKPSLQTTLPSKPDQMPPARAAVPTYNLSTVFTTATTTPKCVALLL